jgi:hypothetical protein
MPLATGTLKQDGRPARVQAVTATGDVIPLAMTLGLLRGADGGVVGAVSVLRGFTDLEVFA